MLVSDGEPTCTPDPCKVAADLAKDGIDLRIDVVGLDVSGQAREDLGGSSQIQNSAIIGDNSYSTMYATTLPVAYNNRQTGLGAAEHNSGPSLAGKYALVLQPGRANNTNASLQIPVTMELAVVGEPSGKPAYVSQPKAVGEAGSAKVKASAEDDDPGLPLLWIGLGVAGVASLAEAFVLFRRSRHSI